MERRKFLGAAPLAAGGILALGAKAAIAQTQSSSSSANVKSFGAVGNGVADDTAAITAAFAYAGSQANPVSVFFPDGTYLISSGFTVPTGVSVFGTGCGTAVIIVSAANITVFSHVNSSFTYTNVSISDLCIQSVQAGVVGIQFTLCEMTSVERLLFEGCTQNIVIDRGQYHRVIDVISRGYGANSAGTFRFWSSVDDDYVYEVHVNSIFYDNIGTGVFTAPDPAALYLRRGVLCYFHQVAAGDLTDGGASGASFMIIENDCQGCKFSQCMGVAPAQGIVIRQGSGVAAYPTFIEFNGVDIDQATEVAVQIDQSKYITYNGGMITPRGGYTNVNPVVVNVGSEFATFNGTMVYGFSGGAGFYFNGGTYVKVNNCVVDSCYYAFVFAAGDHIRINGGSVTNCSSKYNGTYSTVGSYYSEIDGFNPFSVGTPPFPASGATVTNSEGVRCTIYISGGSITGISINGQVIPSGITSGAFDLEPGDTIDINYSALPTWVWVGH